MSRWGFKGAELTLNRAISMWLARSPDMMGGLPSCELQPQSDLPSVYRLRPDHSEAALTHLILLLSFHRSWNTAGECAEESMKDCRRPKYFDPSFQHPRRRSPFTIEWISPSVRRPPAAPMTASISIIDDHLVFYQRSGTVD